MGVIKHDFTFDGVSASAYGLVVYGGAVDEVAAKDVQAVEIPGRNGVLHISNGRWAERTQTYKVFLPTFDNIGYEGRLAWVRTTYGQTSGYKRLSDTFNRDTFSLATFGDAIAPESLAFRTKGVCELTFNCRPERFLKTGDVPQTVTGEAVFGNPTGMPAAPFLRVYGTGAGVLYVGDQILYVDAIDGYVDIDCDLCDCYKGSVNCNGDVRLGEFPRFYAGNTGVRFTGGITSVVVTPRWWSL